MYSYVDHSRIKAVLRPIFSVFLIFTFYFNIFTTAHAGAAESWTIEKVIYDDIGKTLSYTASRPNAIPRNDYVYKAKVAVDAAKTGSTAASMIRFGLAGAAIYGIVEGVGWIIDNGVVKKKVGEVENAPTSEYVWTLGNSFALRENPQKLDCTGTFSSDLLIKVTNRYIYCANNTYKPDSAKCTGYSTLDTYSCEVTVPHWSGDYVLKQTLKRIKNKDYDPTYNPIYAPVSDIELGEAIEKSPSAPEVIPDIYSPNNPVPRPSPAPDAVQTALDNADPESKKPTTSDTEKKPNKDTNGDGVPDQYDPSLPDAGETTSWPLACDWFPAACEFFKVQKQDNKDIKENQQKQLEQDKTFFEKVTDFFDWTKDDSGTQDEPDTPEINQIDIGTLDTSTFRASSGCPAPIQVPVQIGTGGNVEISYEPICQFASKWSFVAPLIGFLSGAMILVGVGRKGEDGEI